MDKIINIANEPISDKEKADKIRSYLSDQLIDSKSAAKYLGISRTTFYSKVEEGKILPVADRYLKSDLDNYLKTKDIDRSKVNIRYNSTESIKSDLSKSNKKSGFLAKVKSKGQTYIYLKRAVTVPGKGQRHKTIHSFGPLPKAIEELEKFLTHPNEIPSSLKEAGFGQSDIRKWIDDLNSESEAK
ncbi:helix-turn-helix domain-containing protein [Bacillus subtilis]|uniref:helix-turn-helix transcriptional regulator n=1 Tax=Bacillus subtilis TaxID=1423 RepID=UPI002041496C|nr:helix-turn-helix domain-containing protein [Bacillus subtilis]MCM3191426.1 helix-turn-helix domain-containing protein [Bacillus subtilis]